jgi:hypothetical protein
VYILVLGAPATGKTTLGCVLSGLLQLFPNVSVIELNNQVDAFIKYYSSVPFLASSRNLLIQYLTTNLFNAEVISRALELQDDFFKPVEIDDVPEYRDLEGRVQRHKTLYANAYIQAKVLNGAGRVIIPGTGFHIHRVLPILEYLKNDYFKVIVPSLKDMGYFQNTLNKAVASRSHIKGAYSIFVPKETLISLYQKQSELLSEGGLFDKLNGVHTAEDLAKIIRAESFSSNAEMETSTVHGYLQKMRFGDL